MQNNSFRNVTRTAAIVLTSWALFAIAYAGYHVSTLVFHPSITH